MYFRPVRERKATHHGTPLCCVLGNSFGIVCVSEPNLSPVLVNREVLGQIDSGSFTIGIRSWPCIAHGSRSPAAEKKVGAKSTPLAVTVHTFPSGTVPGCR